MWNFAPKGLKRLYGEEMAKGVPPDTVEQSSQGAALLDEMRDPEQLRALFGVEGTYPHRRPQRYVEPRRSPWPAFDLPQRRKRARNLRRWTWETILGSGKAGVILAGSDANSYPTDFRRAIDQLFSREICVCNRLVAML
jgi:hypothetical protein